MNSLNAQILGLLLILAAPLYAQNSGQYRLIDSNEQVWPWFEFKYDKITKEEITIPFTITNTLSGCFYLEWRLETNSTPTRATMEKADDLIVTNYFRCETLYATNLMTWWNNGRQQPTPLIEGAETSYVQSNLWAVLVWRGRTNSDCLESIPVRTLTRTWKLEQERKYTDWK